MRHVINRTVMLFVFPLLGQLVTSASLSCWCCDRSAEAERGLHVVEHNVESAEGVFRRRRGEKRAKKRTRTVSMMALKASSSSLAMIMLTFFIFSLCDFIGSSPAWNHVQY